MVAAEHRDVTGLDAARARGAHDEEAVGADEAEGERPALDGEPRGGGRHPHRAGAAGAPGRLHDHDLHPRAPARGVRRGEPTGQALTRPEERGPVRLSPREIDGAPTRKSLRSDTPTRF